jgi:hypothetical protein
MGLCELKETETGSKLPPTITTLFDKRLLSAKAAQVF